MCWVGKRFEDTGSCDERVKGRNGFVLFHEVRDLRVHRKCFWVTDKFSQVCRTIFESCMQLRRIINWLRTF
jgi:hypothetical protein